MHNFIKLFVSLFSPRNVVTVFYYVIGLPVCFLSKIFPKQNIVVFGSRNGRAYDWNSRYIFEYMVALPDCKFECFWITRSQSVYSDLKNINLPVLKMFSYRTALVLLRAKWAVISSSITDIDANLLGGAIVLQTGHGLMIKKIGYGFLDKYENSRGLEKIFSEFYALAIRVFDRQCKFDYVLSPSENFIYRIQQDYRIGLEKIWVTGMPRDDALVAPISKNERLVISYLPTHRYCLSGCTNDLISLFLNYEFIAKDFNLFLEEINAEFVVKAHHLHDNVDAVSALFSNFSRLSIYSGEDAIPLLLTTDILISDYSSIFCEYLQINRPIIFAFFDFEAYISVQSLSNLLDTPPGQVCNSWCEIKTAITNEIKNDLFKEQRLKLRNYLYAFNDGKNCERIYHNMLNN